MTIKELKQELDRFDDNMKVNVFSISNHKDSIISNVVKDGINETYVTLMTEDTEDLSHIKNDDMGIYHPIKINPNTYIKIRQTSAYKYTY